MGKARGGPGLCQVESEQERAPETEGAAIPGHRPPSIFRTTCELSVLVPAQGGGGRDPGHWLVSPYLNVGPEPVSSETQAAL